jgi:cytoskeleton-associated protein 5
MDDEKSLKVLKWNFDVPRKEFVEQLKMQIEPCVNRTLLVQMFHDDFKHHINALQTLLKATDDASDATISNLDLLLKWLTLRFFETNPTVIVKAIDYMQALFTMLASKQYLLIDFEANAFMPYFITKVCFP